ncbi:MAG: hypothetical protein U9M98_03045 [Patescibacteria group bacterium]|nr:hypothetical protein [Patescibacteria group bacterium]
MMSTVHTFVGIAMGLKVTPWPLALALSFLSHFALDLIPHWDFFSFKDEITKRDKINAGLDVFTGFVLGSIFIINALPDLKQALVLAGTCALANLPDALEAPYVFWGNENWVTITTMKIQHIFHGRAHLPWGVITQLGILALAIILLIFPK